MDIRSAIVTLAKKKKKVKSKEITEAFNVSRQYVNTLMRELVSAGTLMKVGSTRSVFYALPSFADSLKTRIKKRFRTVNLEEHAVLQILEQRDFSLNALSENVRSIFTYTFLEMLNNAIEHSGSPVIDILLEKDDRLLFSIRDFGVGVFRNIMKKKHLKSELEAVQDLLKGKTTTAPEAHSGEGIFFTSKAADIFILESYNYKLTIDNTINDIFFEVLKPARRGTRVSVQCSIDSSKQLIDIFKKYQTNSKEKAFDKTQISIKLYAIGTTHISRSQARRVLSGLEKFRLIILDFDRVPNVGQAFADEIFRVFLKSYPSIDIRCINMNEAVRFMIERVGK